MHLDALSPSFSSFLAELNQRADITTLLPDISRKPLRLYINSARMLYRTADVYLRAGDLPNAFVLFLKFSNLLVYGFPRSPEYHANGGRRTMDVDIATLKRNAMSAMGTLETIRPMLETWWTENVQPQLSELKGEEKPKDREELIAVPDTHVNRPDVGLSEEPEDKYTKRQREIERFYEEQVRKSSLNTPREHAAKEQRPADAAQSKQPQCPAVPKSGLYFTESGMPLRRIHVPTSLVDLFLRVSNANTTRNIETCGVICGTLHENAFFVTHLIVPQQTGTSDTCAMLKEEEVAEAAISLNLMTLGWIHTHPRQSCFMSSVDLHTHFPFQVLMAEAIAIVIAPTRDPCFGVFRLTDPPGMKVIGGCRQGGFHAHPASDNELYVELARPTRPGHVLMASGIAISLVDLRSP